MFSYYQLLEMLEKHQQNQTNESLDDIMARAKKTAQMRNPTPPAPPAQPTPSNPSNYLNDPKLRQNAQNVGSDDVSQYNKSDNSKMDPNQALGARGHKQLMGNNATDKYDRHLNSVAGMVELWNGWLNDIASRWAILQSTVELQSEGKLSQKVEIPPPTRGFAIAVTRSRGEAHEKMFPGKKEVLMDKDDFLKIVSRAEKYRVKYQKENLERTSSLLGVLIQKLDEKNPNFMTYALRVHDFERRLMDRKIVDKEMTVADLAATLASLTGTGFQLSSDLSVTAFIIKTAMANGFERLFELPKEGKIDANTLVIVRSRLNINTDGQKTLKYGSNADFFSQMVDRKVGPRNEAVDAVNFFMFMETRY